MRRSDREIKNFEEIVKVLEKCDAVRLAFNDGEYPYIVPLSFGMEIKGKDLTLYFHSAVEGKKLDLMRKDNRVAFEADCSHCLVFDEEQGNCATEYESVVGYGKIKLITREEEKTRALGILIGHYRKEGFPYNPALLPQTVVFALKAESVTGKRRRKRG